MRRKKLLIYPEFQIKFIFHGLLLSGLFLFSFFYYENTKSSQLERLIQELNYAGDHPLNLLIQSHLKERHDFFLVIIAINFAFITLTYLIISHRIAGPITKAISFLKEEYKSGKVLEFRKKDYFQELAAAVNSFIKRP